MLFPKAESENSAVNSTPALVGQKNSLCNTALTTASLQSGETADWLDDLEISSLTDVRKILKTQKDLTAKELSALCIAIGRSTGNFSVKAVAGFLAIQTESWGEGGLLAAEGLAGVGYLQGAGWFYRETAKNSKKFPGFFGKVLKSFRSFQTQWGDQGWGGGLSEIGLICDVGIAQRYTPESSPSCECRRSRNKSCSALLRWLHSKGTSSSLTCPLASAIKLEVEKILCARINCNVRSLMNSVAFVARLVGGLSGEEISMFLAKIGSFGILPWVWGLGKVRRLQAAVEGVRAGMITKIEKLLVEAEKCENFKFDFSEILKQPINFANLIFDDLGNLFFSTETFHKKIPGNRETVLYLTTRLTEILLKNKNDVRSATPTHFRQEVKEFWDERIKIDAEIRQLLFRFEKEVIGGDLFEPEISTDPVLLALPAELLGFPIESIPCLQGKRVLRVSPGRKNQSKKFPGFAVVNPNGDLSNCEEALVAAMSDFKIYSGKKIPSESEFLENLSTQEIFIFAGHCGGDRFWNGVSIQRLQTCPKFSLLLGCRSAEPLISSAPFLTPFNYMIGGGGGVGGFLWDVLGRDCDRFSVSTLENLAGNLEISSQFANAIQKGKNACKLKYLTAASFVGYIAVDL